MNDKTILTDEMFLKTTMQEGLITYQVNGTAMGVEENDRFIIGASSFGR